MPSSSRSRSSGSRSRSRSTSRTPTPSNAGPSSGGWGLTTILTPNDRRPSLSGSRARRHQRSGSTGSGGSVTQPRRSGRSVRRRTRPRTVLADVVNPSDPLLSRRNFLTRPQGDRTRGPPRPSIGRLGWPAQRLGWLGSAYVRPSNTVDWRLEGVGDNFDYAGTENNDVPFGHLLPAALPRGDDFGGFNVGQLAFVSQERHTASPQSIARREIEATRIQRAWRRHRVRRNNRAPSVRYAISRDRRLFGGRRGAKR
ncbi:hypothetical protein WJX74_001386 [Apatococcus lobatus]|uniref:Uncharacterized protein n=1 Tax=Apatococcus lobatus TaxID=904363 RepID=A0AAW1SDV8_9CHLO